MGLTACFLVLWLLFPRVCYVSIGQRSVATRGQEGV